MSNYRRSNIKGGCYFFTVVTHRRQSIFEDESLHAYLRRAILETRYRYPFEIDAWVLLPDHIHCIWTLPEGDADFSRRWSLIKTHFTKMLPSSFLEKPVSDSQCRYRRRGIWQRRFWEHQIHDERDYQNHMDYLHYNPVKHGLVSSVCEWPYSTFHRYVRQGVYPENWGSEPVVSTGEFGE